MAWICVEWMRICRGLSDMDMCGVDENMWGTE